ncbi:MAG: cytochrome c biogenesis protein ResB, partial [Moorella humiferrea]|nr:cytochrome c biogenesis protein ResB [Moorella humiferrea]
MPTESRKPSFFSVLSSMKLGLLLLLILGGMASLGSLVPQAQPPQFYQAYYGALSGRIITFIGLDHVYRSWWFIVTGALLTV